MNNGNILYAFLGGLIVALVWAVTTVSLTMQTLAMGLSAYAVVASLLVAFQDYDHTTKSLR
ncbi:MAG: hypothetical protein SynsKO_40690 [Synoicihabitans sp.]